jgi:hypothetical protein
MNEKAPVVKALRASSVQVSDPKRSPDNLFLNLFEERLVDLSLGRLGLTKNPSL